jgi:O-antigen ligase
LFLANILYVATGRTALVVLPILLVILGFRQLGWKGVVAAGIGVGVLAGVIWTTSPYVRAKIHGIFSDLREYEDKNALTSTGLRLEFYKKSLTFISEAPALGHGTGSIRASFARAATGETGASSIASVNPHNQFFAVAIQIGLVGAGILIAMWIAHLMLFRNDALDRGLPGWIGFVIVAQNVVSSAFNSHLVDFGHGWLYVFGFGVVGGMILRQNADCAGARDP